MKGFTLIELLVVVLIIGILSAVALPQYQKAVDKSRFAKLFPVLKTIMNAQEIYYMANGVYSHDNTALDIDVMSACVKDTSGTSMVYTCPDYVIDANNNLAGMIIVHWCPGEKERENCVQNRLLTLRAGYQYANSSSQRQCNSFHNSKRGTYLCNYFLKDFN